MPTLALVDLAVIVLYLAGVVAVGVRVGRKADSTSEFMAAGGRVPGWAVGLSIFGTYVSSISFLALPGKAYADNWNAFVFSLSIPLTAWIAVRYFVPFYRRAGHISAYEHLESRFGAWARTYAVLCYLLTQLARMGTIMYLLALAIAPLTGLSMPTLIVATGAVVIAYTLVGGMEAVIWTDVVQSVILIAGAGACVITLLIEMPEGPGQLWRIAAAHDKFSLGSFGPSLSQSTFWVVLAYGVAINLQNFGIDQSYVQRYLTARSDREAARSVWFGSLLYLPVSATFFFIGSGLFAFYTARPELLAGSSEAAARPDAVLPYFIVSQFPRGLIGLTLAAILAAAQSTLSSSINCSATLVLCDLYRRYIRPAAGEREAMRVLRAATLVIGVAGTGAALAMLRIKGALDAWWALAGIFSGGMLGLFLLGILAPRAGSRAAAAGVAAGLLVIGWMTFSPDSAELPAWLHSPLHNLLITVLGTATILLVGLAAAGARRAA